MKLCHSQPSGSVRRTEGVCTGVCQKLVEGLHKFFSLWDARSSGYFALYYYYYYYYATTAIAIIQ